MNTQTQVWLLFGVVSALSGILTVAIGWLIWKVRDNGRAWIGLVNEDTGRIKWLRKRPLDGKVSYKAKDGGGREYTLSSRLQDGRRSYFLADMVTGWPYRGLTAKEAEGAINNVGDNVAQVRLRVQNPELAWNMSRNTIRQRWLRSKEDKPDWRVQIAPLALIAVIFMAAAIGFMAWKMNGA